MVDEAILKHIQARIEDSSMRTDMTDVVKADLYPAVSPEELAQCEEYFPFKLPPLLRSIYLKIGNGGFGPGYGLLGISGGHTDDAGRSLLGRYDFALSALSDSRQRWQIGVLPICEWGSEIWSCVDCMSPEWPIITFCDQGFFKVGYDLRSWLEAWTEGKSIWDEMFDRQMIEIVNPFSGGKMNTYALGAPKGEPLS